MGLPEQGIQIFFLLQNMLEHLESQIKLFLLKVEVAEGELAFQQAGVGSPQGFKEGNAGGDMVL